MPTVYAIPDEKIYLEKGYYNYVYFLLQFNRENSVNSKDEQ